MMSTACIEIVTTLEDVRAADVWANVASWLEGVDSLEPQYYVSGTLLKTHMVVDRLRSEHHFGIQGRKFEIQFAPLGNFNHCLLYLVPLNCPRLPPWDLLVVHVVPPDRLVSGRLYDREYERWQNADTPLQYDAAGRDYSHLSTHVDPVFGDTRVDTSSNPGRRIIRNGFVEAVGSTMWLSPRFAERARFDFAKLGQQKWLTVTELPDGIVKVIAARETFKERDPDAAEIQDRLRALLFGVHGANS